MTSSKPGFANSPRQLEADFSQPPFYYHPRPLWFWNGPLDLLKTTEIMEASATSGYAGFGILPAEGMQFAFMSTDFLNHYAHALDQAARLGMKMCLYDEFWFPSGSAGGQLEKSDPEALSQRLDLWAQDFTGPNRVEQDLARGDLMGIVAMNLETQRRLNLSHLAKSGRFSWEVPEGKWKLMIFTCVRDGARGLVNYLDPQAVKKFIELTYDKYYARFPKHFGSTIEWAFYDEPTMHWVQGGRAWTRDFNRKFERRYGYDPVPYYPALWYDIGPETHAARNALFGFRAELYSDGFIRTIQDWCHKHRIALTGHHDQEEIVNPVGLCGDLIKSFRDQDIPGIDQILQYGRASKAYKIVSSAAYNYDRPLVMSECYGAIKDMPVANLYKEAMDQFAKGINLMVPHALWYDTARVVFPPELSYRDSVYGPELPAYNTFVARLQRLLQGGRHVADIAVLYPIATLQAGYRFDVGKPYEGGVIPPEADYMDLGEILATQVRRDFTFIHPEVLDDKCKVKGAELRLENKKNHEQYAVLMIPGSRVIHVSNLEKIKRFYDNGGIVIATTRLPEFAATFGKDKVRQIIRAMFGPTAVDSLVRSSGQLFSKQTNVRGGRAYFLPWLSAEAVAAALDDARIAADVRLVPNPVVTGGNFSYIHKVLDDRHLYFFANSSDSVVDCEVQLRGQHHLSEWNPHTGTIARIEYSHRPEGEQGSTHARLTLPSVQARFWVSEPTQD